MSLPVDEPVRTVGASVADFDGDDDLDLFLLNLETPHQFLRILERVNLLIDLMTLVLFKTLMMFTILQVRHGAIQIMTEI